MCWCWCWCRCLLLLLLVLPYVVEPQSTQPLTTRHVGQRSLSLFLAGSLPHHPKFSFLFFSHILCFSLSLSLRDSFTLYLLSFFTHNSRHQLLLQMLLLLFLFAGCVFYFYFILGFQLFHKQTFLSFSFLGFLSTFVSFTKHFLNPHFEGLPHLQL